MWRSCTGSARGCGLCGRTWTELSPRSHAHDRRPDRAAVEQFDERVGGLFEPDELGHLGRELALVRPAGHGGPGFSVAVAVVEHEETLHADAVVDQETR